ncbi:MAG: GAF domain-containing protein [Myxococcales bacterium]|nr:GAF domain-containing protein [Myxococcales bacterium]MCB9522332.1 GAF domain-containing protein [Myxococcales bacterium]
MGIQAQSAIIAASLLLAIAINVAFQERRVEHRWPFVGLTGAFFLYNLCFFFDAVTGADGWRRALLASGVLVALASLSFFRVFIGRRSMAAPRRVLQGLLLSTAVVVVTDLALSTWMAYAVAVVALGAYGFAHLQLYRHWRAIENPVEIRRLRYLVVGGAVSVTANGLDLLPASGLPFPSFGHLFTTLYLYFWMQVIQRSRLLDLREQLGRGLALVLQSLAVSLIYVALVIWVGQKYGLFVFNTLVAGVVLYFVFEPIKRAVEVWVQRLFFRETHALDAELTALQRELANVINLGDMVDRVLERLQASRRITHASVFLLEDEGRAYFMPRAVGPLELDRLGVVRARHFLDALRGSPVLVLDRVERARLDAAHDPERRDRLGAVRETMLALSADLSFPIRSGERLLGFLNLRDDRAREAFSSAEITRIKQAVRQMATIVENSELIERLKERERLSLIGELATGLAHEIRNPLGAIKAAGQLLEPDELGDEQREFIEVIIEESDRLNGVLSQFLDYARPFRGTMGTLDLEVLLQRVATMVRTEERDPPVEVITEVAPGLPKAVGDGDRLQQVLLNLARNGCEAMEGTGGTLTLAASLEPDGERARVEVRDTGCGVSPEVRANLFTPFFTTKRDGTGLGLAITERILQHHGTRMRIESEPGAGATFAFRLRLTEGAPDRLTGEHRRRLAAETA